MGTDTDWLKSFNELVYATIKDLTYIGTKISDDHKSIEIVISFVEKTITIPITIKNIKTNALSCKGFLELIKKPLEAILEPYIEKYNERNKNVE